MKPAVDTSATHGALAASTEPGTLANRLGWAGLLPFVAGAVLLWLVEPALNPRLAHVLSGYAATIVAFLGGIHWGLAMRAGTLRAGALVWGVVPSLVAWIAVVMQPAAGLVLHGAMLVVCYLVDRRLYPPAGVAHWLTLRFRLSAVAAASCFLGAAATV